MNKYTRGPWAREGYVVERRYQCDKIDLYAEVDVRAGNGCSAPEIAKANAKLIQAAPDLLEACMLFLQARSDYDFDQSLLAKAYEMAESAIKIANVDWRASAVHIEDEEDGDE